MGNKESVHFSFTIERGNKKLEVSGREKGTTETSRNLAFDIFIYEKKKGIFRKLVQHLVEQYDFEHLGTGYKQLTALLIKNINRI